MWILAAVAAMACDEIAFELVESFPGGGGNGIPRDARAVAVVEGYGDPGTWSVEVVGPEGPVDAVYARWGKAVDSPERLRYHVVTTPRNPLLSGVEYRVVVRDGDEIVDESPFRTGANVADDLQGQPVVEVVDVGLPRPGRDACDWEDVENVRLRVTPAARDPYALSLIVLYQGAEGSLLNVPVRTLRAPPDGAPFTIDVRQAAIGLPLCFTAVQENAAGERAVSSWACGVRPTADSLPEPDPEEVGKVVGGACATPGPMSGLAIGAAGLLALLGRRRR